MGDFILVLLLGLILSRPFWRLVGGALRGVVRVERAKSVPPQGVQMERDPVCGTFVVPAAAVTLADGSRKIFFCSTACRDRYRARTA